MAAKTYRCTNFGDCDLALNKEAIEIEEGDDLLCPSCSKTSLAPADAKAAGRKGIGLKVAAAAVVLVAVAAAWALWPSRNPELANTLLSEFFTKLPK